MKKFFFFSMLFLFSFFLFSCNKNNEQITSPILKAQENGHLSKKVNPTAISPFRYIDRYVLDHYEPGSGKIIGIWPRATRWSTNRISELHNKWGFNYLLLNGNYQDAQNAGFSSTNIMIPVDPDNYISQMNTYGNNVYAYYCGEPRDNDHQYNVAVMAAQRNISAPSAKFVIDGYKRTVSLYEASLCAEKIMFSSYVH